MPDEGDKQYTTPQPYGAAAGKTILRCQVLQLAGFGFLHFTHLYRTKGGNTYHFCYDYGNLLLPDEKVLIVNWQPYMEKQGNGRNNPAGAAALPPFLSQQPQILEEMVRNSYPREHKYNFRR